MQNGYSDEQLRLAARLYYVDGLGQTEVAKFAKVSQAKVSRLLALARQRGIVRISVAEYEPRHEELERQLCEQFKLSGAAVIKTIEGSTGEGPGAPSDISARRLSAPSCPGVAWWLSPGVGRSASWCNCCPRTRNGISR